ncbi:MAG: hypothetical protein QOH79_1166 [Acidimicrobiaceae bacterium]
MTELEDDDLDDDDDFDDELELFDDDDDELDELLADVTATFFLSSPPSSRNAAIAMAATASTPPTIHFVLFDPAPGAPGGGPTGGPGGGPSGAPGGGSGATGGMAVVGGAGGGIAVVGGGIASIGCVAPAWKFGCCSGGYHFPSDACHQPSPCVPSLMGSHCRSGQRSSLASPRLAIVMASGNPVVSAPDDGSSNWNETMRFPVCTAISPPDVAPIS